MKRIDIEEAKKYVSLDDNFLNHTIEHAVFFTLTPMDDGWEKVTYYTARKKNIYSGVNKDYDSWVYVFSNPSLPGLYKVGYTKNNPEDRAKQLSRATGVALPYVVEWIFPCFNGENLEYEVHKYLDKYRVNNQREFFSVEIDEIKKAVNFLGKNYI
jgi:hypothetical protein